MKRPTQADLIDAGLIALTMAPWALAYIRLRRARAVAPMDAIAWYQVSRACAVTALRIGQLGLAAEKRYWKVVQHAGNA